MKFKSFLFSCFFFGLLATLSGGLNSCKGDDDEEDTLKIEPHHLAPVKIVSPANQEQFIFGDVVEIEIEVMEPQQLSEMKLLIDGKVFKDSLASESMTIKFATNKYKLGDIKILLSYLGDDGKTHGDNREITVFSDTEPKEMDITIVQYFPHDPTSYTQGLEFYKGRLYEGTGQYGKSRLLEVDLKTGRTLRSGEMDNKDFGEGITVLNDTIYQLTYREHTCYYYDMDFNLLGQFNYEQEGWGLCNDGKNIIMSNGTHQLVWRDPKTFAVVKELEVYTDTEGILNVNELELIDGYLFANIYEQDYIIEIDTATGKVLTKIDCSALSDQKPIGANVLNGIARNPETGKIYMCGKWWDKLFEVIIE